MVRAAARARHRRPFWGRFPERRRCVPRDDRCRSPALPQVVPAFWWHMTLNLEDAVILKREPATLQRDLGLAPAAGGKGGVGVRAEL